jgi:hypothetical protein
VGYFRDRAVPAPLKLARRLFVGVERIDFRDRTVPV